MDKNLEEIKEQLSAELRKALETEYVGKPAFDKKQQELMKRKTEEFLREHAEELGLPVRYEVNITLED
jgi:hypothetical protein